MNLRIHMKNADDKGGIRQKKKFNHMIEDNTGRHQIRTCKNNKLILIDFTIYVNYL